MLFPARQSFPHTRLSARKPGPKDHAQKHIKACLQIQIISGEIFRIALDELNLLIAGQLYFQLVDNRSGNIDLNGKHVAQLAIIFSRPELKAIIDAGELRGEAQPISRFAHTPFQHVADIELFAGRANILLFAFEGNSPAARYF